MRMSSRGFRVCVFLAVLTLAAFSGCGVEKHLDESVEPLYMAVGDGGTVVYTSGGDPGN